MGSVNFITTAPPEIEQDTLCPQFSEMVRNIELHQLADYHNDAISNLHLFTKLVWEKALDAHMAACTACQKQKGSHQ